MNRQMQVLLLPRSQNEGAICSEPKANRKRKCKIHFSASKTVDLKAIFYRTRDLFQVKTILIILSAFFTVLTWHYGLKAMVGKIAGALGKIHVATSNCVLHHRI